jgi:hypothetical protein
MGAMLPWLVSQLGKNGIVRAGEEAHFVPFIVEPVKMHEASVRALTFTLPE